MIFTKKNILFSVFCLQAQNNLIRNPSFESYSNCPTTTNQLYYTNDWHSLDSTALYTNSTTGICNGEYFNTCANSIGGDYYGVPGFGSFLNYQFPKSGTSYVGILFRCVNLSSLNHDRDYAQSRLIQSLVNGKTYCFKIWVNLSNQSDWALDNIQAYFDNGIIDTASNCGKPIAITPQVKNAAGNVISDSLNWVLVKGSFVANGTEKYVTIGNFYTDSQTQLVQVNNLSSSQNEAYYLVDDVSLIASDLLAYAGNDTSTCKGDSIYIGRPSEIGLDNIWHNLQGDLIGTGAGVWIKPDTTTTYVVTQDLCGTVTYDTIKVTVNCIGIRQYYNAAQINIFPNPANEILNIEVINYKTQETEISIVDVLGNEVKKQKTKDKNIVVDISEIENGIYFVNIKTGEGTFTKKIIIQR